MANNLAVGIFGFKGFIGSHLLRHLAKQKIDYVCFDGNALSTEDVESFFDKHPISQIIFLIGSFNPPFVNLIEKNLLTLQNVLDIGIKHNLKKVILTSTGAVYGEPINKYSKEDDALRPNTLYSLSKKFTEECLLYYANNFNLNYVILRYPNVYGENNTKGVIYSFLTAIKTSGQIMVEGDGSQKRNFLYVEDACRAIVKALVYKKSGIFNISNLKSISISELVNFLQKKYSFTVTNKPLTNNLKVQSLDIHKAKTILKFIPKFTELKI